MLSLAPVSDDIRQPRGRDAALGLREYGVATPVAKRALAESRDAGAGLPNSGRSHPGFEATDEASR